MMFYYLVVPRLMPREAECFNQIKIWETFAATGLGFPACQDLSWGAWIRTRILASKGQCPTVRRLPSSSPSDGGQGT